MKAIFRTESGWMGLVLRVGLGVVFFPHGAQKLFGLFGGPGFAGAMAMFTQKMHVPAPLAFLVILAESAGAVALVLGLLTRVAAFGLLCDMFGAVLMVHLPFGFFMNWMGNQPGEGFEYHILAISISLALMIGGGGKWSADGMIAERMR